MQKQGAPQRLVNEAIQWLSAILGIGAVVIPIALAVWDEIPNAPKAVQLALFTVGAAWIATGLLAFGFWKSLRTARLSLTDTLGILKVDNRDATDARLPALYRRVASKYHWTGLSAINELARTDIPEIIAQRTAIGKNFAYILLDPDDPLRVKEQFLWENAPTRPHAGDLAENIRRSIQVLKRFKDNARVHVLAHNRIPAFRVVRIDDREIHVGHYDKSGCGYYGDFLRLYWPQEQHEPGLLFGWFQRFAQVEEKNAAIDTLYSKMVAVFLKTRDKEATIRQVLDGSAFREVRATFDKYFDWSLSGEDVRDSLNFLIQKYELDAPT